MHPANGYPLSQLTLKDSERTEAISYLAKANNHLESIGMNPIPVESLDLELTKVSIGDLRTILELRPFMIEMSLIHPRVELSTEYIQLQQLIDKKVPQTLNKAEAIVKKLDADFKKEYKKALEDFSRKAVNLSYSLDKQTKEKHQEKFEQYLAFSEFKPLIDQVIGENVVLGTIFSYETDYQTTLANLFNTMKNKVMAAKANIPSLVAQYGTEIPVEQIKDQDPIAYEYLRSKAFAEVAMENFGISIPFDKTFEQRIVRPNDALAERLKLKPIEMAIFAISVDPVRNFGLAVGQYLESSQVPFLKFKVLNEQKQMKVIQKIKVQVNEDEFIYVITPVYVSYIKAELIKNQQSASIKQV